MLKRRTASTGFFSQSETINPPWVKEQVNQQNSRRNELPEGIRQLANTLAFVTSGLVAEEIKNRYLQKFFELQGEVCISFITSFVDLYIHINILNSENIEKEAIQVIDYCVERILKDPVFKSSSHQAGRVYSVDLPELIPTLLFIQSNKYGARRFANDDWQDINIVMPIIDKFISKAGWMPTVITHYLTLCEQAIKYYPIEQFTDQMLLIIIDYSSLLIYWKGTTILARIASLIQLFAENNQPLEISIAQKLLRMLDTLVDMGDRRSAALQNSETFRNVKLADSDLI